MFELYDLLVQLPVGEELKRVMAVCIGLGFIDAMAFADVTCVYWRSAPVLHAPHFTGKEKIPTLAYEMLVEHTSPVLSATYGPEGSQNDETIVRLDSTISNIRKEGPYPSTPFTVLNRDGTETTRHNAFIFTVVITS